MEASQPELHTVQYIKQHGLEKLVKDFSLSSKRHSKYTNLILLKYDQLESNMSSPIVQECRGITGINLILIAQA